jgi:hypothetical protein
VATSSLWAVGGPSDNSNRNFIWFSDPAMIGCEKPHNFYTPSRKMPNFLTRLILFLSSYAPLFLIVAMRGWRDTRPVAYALIGVAVVSVIVLFVFLSSARKLAPGKVSVASVVSRDGDVMSYIVTYLLPFLAVKLNDPMDVGSLVVVFIVIAILYVNSNMIQTNPVLNLVGYHVFEIEDADGKNASLICKRTYIRTGSEINAVSIGDYVLLEKK